MMFLHPEYLWWLFALCIPVIIHLFDFRKNRRVYFSDIQFLKQVKHASRKPLKLKQWLILFSRLGFIAFLVFVFAQPILPTSNKKQLTTGTKLIYIDNSLSMNTPLDPNESALDKAREVGQSILTQFPKGQEVIVVDNDDLAQFWSPQNSKEASDHLASVEFSEQPFSLDKLGIALKEYQRRESKLSDVFIISDFQKSTTETKLNALDTAIHYWITPVQPESFSNCVVDSVYRLVSDIASDNNVKIQVVIRNMGAADKEDLPIKVFLGDRQISAVAINIPAYQRKNISFSIGKVESFESGNIQIDDYPVSFDNIFYFALQKKKAINVVELVGETPSEYVRQVFGNKKLFLIERSDWRSIDYTLFDEANFIVLNQIDRPEPELLDRIKEFAQTGGSVLIVPGQNVDIDSYGQLKLNLKKVSRRKQKLRTPAKNTPFFEGIMETSNSALAMPQAMSVWGWGPDRSAILSFEDNTPYLSEVTNNMFVISAPLVDSLSDVQTHALFVPIMYRLASRSTAPDDKLFTRVNSEYVDVEIDSANFRDVIKLKQGEIELIPDKQKVANKWRLSFPKGILKSGVFEVEVNKHFEGYLAFNSDKKESQLEPLSTNEIKELFSAYNYNILDAFDSKQKRIESLDGGIALWKYALVICLLFLLTEALLIRFL